MKYIYINYWKENLYPLRSNSGKGVAQELTTDRLTGEKNTTYAGPPYTTPTVP